MHYAGVIEEHPETWLSDARFATLVDGVHHAAERCRERGFEVALHYHAGTYVERRGRSPGSPSRWTGPCSGSASTRATARSAAATRWRCCTSTASSSRTCT